MPRVVTTLKHITELTNDEYFHLKYNLNMGSAGSMRRVFNTLRGEGRGWAVMHHGEDGIDGWGMLFKDVYCEHGGDKNLALYLYVDPDRRRQGIATKIMQHARLVEPMPLVVPWDETSADFYRSQSNVQFSWGHWGRTLAKEFKEAGKL